VRWRELAGRVAIRALEALLGLLHEVLTLWMGVPVVIYHDEESGEEVVVYEDEFGYYVVRKRGRGLASRATRRCGSCRC